MEYFRLKVSHCAAHGDAHVVHQQVQSPESGDGLFDQSAPLLGVADVAANHVHARRVFFDGRFRRVEALLVSSVQNHGCATLGTGDGDGFADASAGPRDDNDFVGEVRAKVG